MWFMLEGEFIWNVGGCELFGCVGFFVYLFWFILYFFMNKGEKLVWMV